MPPADPSSMPLDAVISLMLMLGVRGRPGTPDFERDLAACEHAKVGGVCLFDVHLPDYLRHREAGTDDRAARLDAPRNIESPAQVAALCDQLRARLGPAVMISVDQEGGMVARLNPLRGFPSTPSPAAVGEMEPAERAQAAGVLARTVRDAGIDVNFAPCLDAAVNSANPIIAGKQRSYGIERDHIAACANEVIEAHTRLGVATCLKHFPGHGSSTGDTHAGFVDVTAAWRADPELAVYQRLIPRIDPARTLVMTGHLYHAGIDADHPASLSRAHTIGLLRESLGFTGVVVTDSLDMGAVTRRYGPDEAIVLAINAGADILLDGFNAPDTQGDHPAPRMHAVIAQALRDGRIDGGEARLRTSAARIARLRRWSTADIMPA